MKEGENFYCDNCDGIAVAFFLWIQPLQSMCSRAENCFRSGLKQSTWLFVVAIALSLLGIHPGFVMMVQTQKNLWWLSSIMPLGSPARLTMYIILLRSDSISCHSHPVACHSNCVHPVSTIQFYRLAAIILDSHQPSSVTVSPPTSACWQRHTTEHF